MSAEEYIMMHIGNNGNHQSLIARGAFTRHGAIFGQTGSGKTGLSIAILEEFLREGTPVFAIDPKGDLGNMLLTFPEMSAREFHPWTRKTPDVAHAVSSKWRQGLAKSGISPDDVKSYADNTSRHIFTPGKLIAPLSVLNVPEDVDDIPVFLTTLFSIVDLDFDFHDSEYVLLSKVIEALIDSGRKYTIIDIAKLVYNPPFDQVGFLSINEFLSKKKRTDLARLLNNLFVSPTFKKWITGPTLDIDSMLYDTETGNPRLNVFNIAGLTDSERMAFVTNFFESVNNSMRGASSHDGVRFVVYMDEIFGYMPPVSNPPSKKPIMTTLKQGRAFGISVILSTQNPKDIDYKGMSNIRNWFAGTLNTKKDRERLVEGMTSESSADAKLLDARISRLSSREFLYFNGKESTTFKSRHTMSYLFGPMSDGDVKLLVKKPVVKSQTRIAERVQARQATVSAKSASNASVSVSSATVDRDSRESAIVSIIRGLFYAKNRKGRRK